MKYSSELLAAPKTDRYRIEGLLGRGATSLVYKAFDKESNFYVALKSIRFPDQDGIYRLKEEFRSFRDLYHPNIVELYNLYVDEEFCFYSMELIDGPDFVKFVRLHENSLRSCLGQLVEGLSAVHESGRLHRDLKPGNILAEKTGRVVLLDFGLAVERRANDSVVTQGELYGGTPAYMAPERIVGEPATAASDLYALGVIAYEALSGQRPFPNLSLTARYEAAKTGSPPSPKSHAAEAPEDLSRLAMRLLSFDPAARPPLAEVKWLLQFSDESPRPAGRPRFGSRTRAFVGRTKELAELDDALAHTLSGRRVTVHVSGVSGVGKTCLVEEFLAKAREQLGALALRSRCHHQESVRYNAVDGLVDMLSHHLVGEPEERLAQITPSGLPALVTMFPILARIAWPTIEVDQDELLSDPQSLVRQALGALRRLFRQIAAGRPLILWIDDVQWSDASSLPILDEIVANGDEPILTIFSYKSEDLQANSVISALEFGEAMQRAIEVRHIRVEPFDTASVAALLQAFSDERTTDDPRRLLEVVRLSGGLPIFVLQLANDDSLPADTGRDDAIGQDSGSGIRADSFLASRIQMLARSQRAILEIVAVAGRPLAEEILMRVAMREAATGREVYQLLNQSLVRKAETKGKAAIETYHERIRTAVLGSLTDEARRIRHLQIAEALEQAPALDHPLLAEHFLGAGERRKAGDHAIYAAREAKRRLAFNQAAEFLLLAARLRDSLANDAALLVELAQALADSGRSSEASDLFLRAANASQNDKRAALAHKAQAARHLLYSGRLSESRVLHRELFADLGIAFPRTVREALRMSIVNRILFAIGLKRLRLPGPRNSRIPDTLRVETLWAAAIGFLMLDFVVGDAMLARYMREAATLGEASSLLRALALEGSAMANFGRPWSVRRAGSLLRLAEDYAQNSSDPYDRVVVLACKGGAQWHLGRWGEAARLTREAIETHQRECVRYDFAVSIARGYRIAALAMRGSIRQAKSDALEAVEDARMRGDNYVSRSFLSGYYVYIALAEDSPETIVNDSAAVLQDLPSDRFTSLHWMHLTATANALVYAGEPWEAWALVQARWPLIQAAGFLKLGCVGAHVREIRARVALGAASGRGPPRSLAAWSKERLLSLAAEDALKIERTTTLSHATATGAAIRSRLAAINGNTEQQRRLLEMARRGFADSQMPLHSAAAELQLAVAGSRTSDSAADKAWGIMADEGARRPNRMASFLMFAL